IAGARVFQDVLDADGATALQGFDVPGERGNLPRARVFVAVGVAAVRGDGFQPFAVQLPESGTSQTVGLAGGASDQLGRFQLRIDRTVAMPCQTHDQALLRSGADQLLQLATLGSWMGTADPLPNAAEPDRASGTASLRFG